MGIYTLFLTAFLVGLTGAVMPGPMLTVTLDRTTKIGWIAGPLVVVGHVLLEFVLVVSIVFGFSQIITSPLFTGLVGTLGGAILVWMAIGVIRHAGEIKVPNQNQLAASSEAAIKPDKSLLATVFYGITTSLSNPYWFLWWGSVGAGYVSLSLNSQGYLGLSSFFTGHILADFVWFTAVAVAMEKGGRLLPPRVFLWFLRTLGLFLIGFAFFFIYSGLSILRSL